MKVITHYMWVFMCNMLIYLIIHDNFNAFPKFLDLLFTCEHIVQDPQDICFYCFIQLL